MMIKKSNGFTLIELLISISIVALLSTTVLSSTKSGLSRSQAAYELRVGNAIIQAFSLKALDENVTTWWHEDDFPPSVTWGSYIQDIIAQDIISEFLPTIPDNQGLGGTSQAIPYAYDNDGDTFSDPSDCFSNSSLSNSFRGVNLVYNLGINQTDQKWLDIVEYLDSNIDGSDGPYCGKLRYALAGGAGERGQIIYSIDTDQYPDH